VLRLTPVSGACWLALARAFPSPRFYQASNLIVPDQRWLFESPVHPRHGYLHGPSDIGHEVSLAAIINEDL
jgi:hypothetical protein